MSNKLRKLREERGLSCEQLAVMTGVSYPAIALYQGEKRKPTVVNAIRIARALGTTVEALWGDYAND